jgi:hypothetical protein
VRERSHELKVTGSRLLHKLHTAPPPGNSAGLCRLAVFFTRPEAGARFHAEGRIVLL